MMHQTFLRQLLFWLLVGIFSFADESQGKSLEDVVEQGIAFAHKVTTVVDDSSAKGRGSPQLKHKKLKRVELTPALIAKLTGTPPEETLKKKKDVSRPLHLTSTLLTSALMDFLTPPKKQPALFSETSPYGKLFFTIRDTTNALI